MAVTHASGARNAMADAVDDQVNAGSTDAAGDLVILANTTELCRIVLGNPAFGSASVGAMSLNGLPRSGTATAAGTANKFEFHNRNNAMVVTGTITATGGGGDMTVDNTSIALGQTVEVTSGTYNAAP